MNIIIFGPPGAGKGTQSDKLIEKYDLTHIATGDLFRMHLGNNTPLGLEAKKYMEEGNLVPDKVVIDMVEDKIQESVDSSGFIFDGFPRTVNQAISLDSMLSSKELEINFLISLTVDDKELISRIKKRSLVSGRVDDQSEEKINNRKNNLDNLKKSISILNPLSILDRGYSIILNKKGSAIKSSKDVNKGENLKARLSKGTIDIEVK